MVTDLEKTHGTESPDDQVPSMMRSGSVVPFNEKDVLFPNDVDPSSLERRRYIIAEFNLVKRRMKEEEGKHRADSIELDADEPTGSAIADSERSGLDEVEISKSTVKAWKKLLEEPIDFTWERPGLSDHNAHFDKDQQDVAIMYTYHEYLEESHREACTRKGELAKAIIQAMDEGVMDEILASPPASDSTTDSPDSGSKGSDDNTRSGSSGAHSGNDNLGHARGDSAAPEEGSNGDEDDDSDESDESEYESARSSSSSSSDSDDRLMF